MLQSDGFIHLLSDPWAEHPVVNRHVMNGGGDGGGGAQFTQQAPSVPDYSQYIAEMTKIGQKGQTWAGDLFDWAKSTGKDLMTLATSVSGKAGAAADTQQQASDRLMSTWEQAYGPLYEAQRADASRMIGELPRTEEQYAGKFGADAATMVDQQKASAQRDLAGRGFAPTAIGTQALDTAAGVQRAAATTAASEQGRLAARSEARGATGTALTAGQFIPGVGATQGGQATGNRNQALNTQLSGASTGAGLYAPGMGMYSAAFPYMQQWGNTMATDFNQRMQQFGGNLQAFSANQKAQQDAAEGGGFMNTILPLAGGIAGSFLGPMGSMAGSAIGKIGAGAMSGSGMTFERGGPVRGRRVRFANGGAADSAINLVPPEASPSGGENVDDVPAMVSEGEFVIPTRTVDWYGEKFFQNLIMKADKEQQTETVAQAEEGPAPEAIQAQAPAFRSEGARV